MLIDLISETGDPVLSLASLDAVISANDDGGGARNARIERYLSAGIYFIEATTYLERDYQPLRANFTLTVHLVDEATRHQSFHLKIEETHVPDEVVAGDPFTVNYRVGNAGGGDLPADGSTVTVYVVGRRVFEILPPLTAARGRWQAGVVYHSGEQTAIAASVAIDEVMPFEVTFGDPGPRWVFVAVITDDPEGEELGFQGLWQNLLVLSGPTFEPVNVEVDGAAYWVSASADAEGLVTTSVKSVAHPSEEVDEATRAKAVYAAGVRTQLLDGIFERPAIAALAEAADPSAAPVAVSVANPSSTSLTKAFGARYASAVGASGLPETVAAGEAINPIAIEDLTLAFAESASGEYASLAGSWGALLAPEPPPAEEPTEEPAPLPHRLRIIARLGDGGRVEHGVELISGFQILPDVRYLRADAPVDTWQFSSDVELGDDLIGRIRARRLADGRVEMGFEDAGGEGIVPDVRYLPADLPEGIWFRSGEIEIPAAWGR